MLKREEIVKRVAREFVPKDRTSEYLLKQEINKVLTSAGFFELMEAAMEVKEIGCPDRDFCPMCWNSSGCGWIKLNTVIDKIQNGKW